MEKHPLAAILDELDRKGYKVYDTGLIYDLGTARTDVAIDIAGDFLAVESLDGVASIRFNDKGNRLASLNRLRRFVTPFRRLFLTNTSQVGKTLILAIGRDAFFSAKALEAMKIANSSGTDIDPLIKVQLPSALTGGGNLKISLEESAYESTGGNIPISVEEAAIAVPADIQARYNLKSTRTVATPANNTVYWLPATGDIDLSNFEASTWFIHKVTNKPASVELHISLDGGTTFIKAEGYEILNADFVLATWNSIHCPLMLAEAKLKVTAGATGAGALDLAVVRKA